MSYYCHYYGIAAISYGNCIKCYLKCQMVYKVKFRTIFVQISCRIKLEVRSPTRQTKRRSACLPLTYFEVVIFSEPVYKDVTRIAASVTPVENAASLQSVVDSEEEEKCDESEDNLTPASHALNTYMESCERIANSPAIRATPCIAADPVHAGDSSSPRWSGRYSTC